MRRSYNDDDAEWLANHPDAGDDAEETNDALDDHLDSYNDDDADVGTYDDVIRDSSICPISWTDMKFDDDTYLISTDGHIRNAKHSMFAVSSGYRVEGTPYRATVLHVQGAPYSVYLHDLVWRAFNGDVPKGWTVRHIDLSTDSENCYSNSIDNLRIVKMPAPNLYA